MRRLIKNSVKSIQKGGNSSVAFFVFNLFYFIFPTQIIAQTDYTKSFQSSTDIIYVAPETTIVGGDEIFFGEHVEILFVASSIPKEGLDTVSAVKISNPNLQEVQELLYRQINRVKANAKTAANENKSEQVDCQEIVEKIQCATYTSLNCDGGAILTELKLSKCILNNYITKINFGLELSVKNHLATNNYSTSQVDEKYRCATYAGNSNFTIPFLRGPPSQMILLI